MTEQHRHLLAQEIIKTSIITEQAQPNLQEILSQLTEYNDHSGALVIIAVMTGDRALVNVAKTLYLEREEMRGLSYTASLLSGSLRDIVISVYPETYEQVREFL